MSCRSLHPIITLIQLDKHSVCLRITKPTFVIELQQSSGLEPANIQAQQRLRDLEKQLRRMTQQYQDVVHVYNRLKFQSGSQSDLH